MGIAIPEPLKCVRLIGGCCLGLSQVPAATDALQGIVHHFDLEGRKILIRLLVQGWFRGIITIPSQWKHVNVEICEDNIYEIYV